MLRLAPFALLLSACPFPGEYVACEEYAVSSVMLTVVDEDGSTPIDATVTATDADGNVVETHCATDNGATVCSEWVVGYEVAGDITIEASANDGCNEGYGILVVDVPLTEDECHVETQDATLVVNEWTDLDCM